MTGRISESDTPSPSLLDLVGAFTEEEVDELEESIRKSRERDMERFRESRERMGVLED